MSLRTCQLTSSKPQIFLNMITLIDFITMIDKLNHIINWGFNFCFSATSPHFYKWMCPLIGPSVTLLSKMHENTLLRMDDFVSSFPSDFFCLTSGSIVGPWTLLYHIRQESSQIVFHSHSSCLID